MTTSNSLMAGWADLNLKSPNGSLGTSNSEFTLNDSFLYSTNIHSGESNTYGNICVEDNDITITLNRSEIYAYSNVNTLQTAFILSGDGMTNCKINVNDSVISELRGDTPVVYYPPERLIFNGN